MAGALAAAQRVPARVLDGGVVVDSLLSPGVRVAGRVERSVLGPGVVVEAGALVADSVVFADTVVRAGAEVHWSVLDVRCVVEPDARVGAADANALEDPDAVTLVGCDSTIGPGIGLPAGARLEPGTVAGSPTSGGSCRSRTAPRTGVAGPSGRIPPAVPVAGGMSTSCRALSATGVGSRETSVKTEASQGR